MCDHGSLDALILFVFVSTDAKVRLTILAAAARAHGFPSLAASGSISLWLRVGWHQRAVVVERLSERSPHPCRSTAVAHSLHSGPLSVCCSSLSFSSRFACEIIVEPSLSGMIVVIPDYPERP